MDPVRALIHLGLKATETSLDRALDVVRLADTLLVSTAVPTTPARDAGESAWPQEERADLDALSATLRARTDDPSPAATKPSANKAASTRTGSTKAPAKKAAAKKAPARKTAAKKAPARKTASSRTGPTKAAATKAAATKAASTKKASPTVRPDA